MKRNYDTVAVVYDRLAKLVYGNTLVQVQQYLLNAIPANARVLIAGGGTGWVLEEIAKIHPAGLIIDYVDISAKMIALARKRNAGGNSVSFFTAPIQDMQFTSQGYDVILTPFLFDNFTDSALQAVFPSIDKQLKQSGVWLYCDFLDTQHPAQKLLLKTMYLFFRLFCGIKTSKLPDIATLFAEYGYKVRSEKMYLNGFIAARVYRRV